MRIYRLPPTVVVSNHDVVSLQHVLDTNCTIKTVCGVMTDASLGDPYYRFAAFVRLRTITHLLKPCFKDITYNANLQDLRNTSYSGPHGGGGEGVEGQRTALRGRCGGRGAKDPKPRDLRGKGSHSGRGVGVVRGKG